MNIGEQPMITNKESNEIKQQKRIFDNVLK